jgi:bifunctional UDP-N-acetylglucosamine pyrophosphorylase / glucosamine-1-phosphate N-acetyltransferase
MTDLYIVILAAGKGTRMKSARPKILHDLAGRSLIEHVLHTIRPLGAVETVMVVGHGADEVQDALREWPALKYVVQSPQLGTGHALLQTRPVLDNRAGSVLLLYADVPLLQSGTLSRLVEHHHASHAAATVLTAEFADPYGYGRIVRDPDGRIARIVEERDASADERRIREINSGIYTFSLGPLFDAVQGLATDNAQGEYYLTDLIAAYRRRRLRVETLSIDDAAELRGVNTRVDLAELAGLLRERKRRALMLDGVTLDDPATAYIDADVEIGADTTIGPSVVLSGRTVIGARCRIHAGVRLTDAVLGDDVTVLDHSVIEDTTLPSGTRIGPFATLP